MSPRKRAVYYLALGLFCLVLYTGYDFATIHQMDGNRVFQQWTLAHARHVAAAFRDGHPELIRGHHFFPMWGAGIFLALTDVGLLENARFLCFRFSIAAFLAASVLLGASVLRHRFGDRAFWFAPLLAFNPIFFQIVGGVYDQFLFAAMICCGVMLLVKTECSERHRWHWTIAGAVLFGLAANVRSDWTYTYPLFLLLRVRGADRRRFLQLLASGFIFFGMLLPWAALYHQRSGLWSFTSANAGQVAYISLGESGDGNPWGVFPYDGWDGAEVGRRVKSLHAGDYRMSSVFSDPWASTAYFGMFKYKIMKDPYAYWRLSLSKMRSVLFSESPRLYSLPVRGAPFLVKMLVRIVAGTIREFHRFSLWVLFIAGAVFVLRGPRHPLLEIGGFFAVVTVALTTLFQFIDRHLFPLAAAQGLVVLVLCGEALSLLLPLIRRESRIVIPWRERRLWLPVILYAVPVLFLVFVYRPPFAPWEKNAPRVERVKFWEVSTYTKPNGALWNRTGNYIFGSRGIWIELPETNYVRPIEVSLNNVCDYVVTFYQRAAAGQPPRPVGVVNLPRNPVVRVGLANHFVPIPSPARTRGYNLIHIAPLAPAGERFSLGHLVFRNAPREQETKKTLSLVDRSPVADGTQWNRTGNVVFYYDGLRISLEGERHDRAVQLSLDGNDRYKLLFQRAADTVGEVAVGPSAKVSGGLANYRAEVPETAVRQGYDTIRIQPAEGDGSFSLGHLRLEP